MKNTKQKGGKTVKRTIAVVMFFVFMLVVVSASYAQTMDQLVKEQVKLTDDLKSYRAQAAQNIKGAEVRIIELNAIISDRKAVAREAAASEEALKAAEIVEVEELIIPGALPVEKIAEEEGVE